MSTLETFQGPRGSRRLEVRGNELFLRTGSTPLDEVREVYASPADAALAAN